MPKSPEKFTVGQIKEFAERLQDFSGRVLAFGSLMDSSQIGEIEIATGAAHGRIMRDLATFCRAAQDGVDQARRGELDNTSGKRFRSLQPRAAAIAGKCSTAGSRRPSSPR